MPDLPSGTVTFLFTDIEGSTRLVHALGDAYAKVRSEHTGIIRSAIAAGDGTGVDNPRHAFFSTLARPPGAVNAPAIAQPDLHAPPLPEGPRAGGRQGPH